MCYLGFLLFLLQPDQAKRKSKAQGTASSSTEQAEAATPLQGVWAEKDPEPSDAEMTDSWVDICAEKDSKDEEPKAPKAEEPNNVPEDSQAF